jgi:hypothetical protein
MGKSDWITVRYDFRSRKQRQTENATVGTITVAMPRLIKMLIAMNSRKRVAALEHGQIALELLAGEP